MNFSAQTDSAQRFNVQSNLIYAIWKSKAAYGDSDATFEVRTSFVGDGADVKIKGKTENGKNLGKLDAKIYGNRLIAGFPIPKTVPADDFVYLEVQLPKQGLKGETNRIPTRPPIQVQQMKWSAKEARRGDVLTLSVDFQSQIPNDTDAIVAIYEYDHYGSNHDPVVRIPTTVQNKKIQVQWEYEYFDDTKEIPTKQDLQPHGKNYNHPEYFFVVVLDEIRIGVKQESGLLRFKDRVEFKLVDSLERPIANTQFSVIFSDGKQSNGTTDSNGVGIFDNCSPGPYHLQVQGIDNLRSSLE
jgi:hypothetical protein